MGRLSAPDLPGTDPWRHLPQVSTEDLDQGDLQCGDLAVHEDSRQIQLHLETYIHLKYTKHNRVNH